MERLIPSWLRASFSVSDLQSDWQNQKHLWRKKPTKWMLHCHALLLDIADSFDEQI